MGNNTRWSKANSILGLAQLATIIAIFFSLSCKPLTQEPVPTPTPSVPVTIEKVSFIPDSNYSTNDESVMIVRAGHKMNEVVQSDCFKNFMSNRKMIQTNGLLPVQVATRLQSLEGVIPVQMYSRCMSFNVFKCPVPTSAVAYRAPPALTINLNRVYFNIYDKSLTVCDWAATMGHESLGHSLGGYDHDFNWNPTRDFSVPYSIGGSSTSNSDAFQACCKE